MEKEDTASKITMTVFIGFVLLINSVMITSWLTRRPADDIYKIEAARRLGDASEVERLKACTDAGGRPDWYDGKLADCDNNK